MKGRNPDARAYYTYRGSGVLYGGVITSVSATAVIAYCAATGSIRTTAGLCGYSMDGAAQSRTTT
ncbi:MAG: hypothetical protein U9Q37_03175 [Euryarchaeota archaeon]|nr:hypothetical protein [Euryarchaeota archaeon]